MELEQPAVADSTPAATTDTQDSGQVVQDTPDPSATPDDNSDLVDLLPPDDGTEEVEWEGEKHRIPSKLKGALMAHADYTRKTQEVAEQRRQIEAQAQEVRRQSEFQRQNLQEVAQVYSLDSQVSQIDAQLAEYAKVDWATLVAQNPQQAQLLDLNRKQLEYQKNELQGKKSQLVLSLQAKEREGLEKQRQQAAMQIEHTQREIARRIKGWSPSVANELSEYGRTQGFPAEVLTPGAPPVFVETLHKAMQWDRLLAQRNAKRTPQQPDKPVTRVTATSSPATKDPDKMSADEWAKWRNAELAKRSKRR